MAANRSRGIDLNDEHPKEPKSIPSGVTRKACYEMSLDFDCGDEYFVSHSDGDRFVRVREDKALDSDDKATLESRGYSTAFYSG